MENVLNDYLEKVEKYLKPMAVSERIDIVKEIKSEMIELQSNGTTTEAILERLGNPKELAKAYLGEAISKNTSFNWHNLCSVIAFYSLVSTVWMFILPFTSILGIAFMVSGVISPIGGIIKFVGYLLGYEIPQIGFTIGSFSASAITFLPLSIVLGVVFFIVGKLFWNLTIKLIKGISKTKEKIQH